MHNTQRFDKDIPTKSNFTFGAVKWTPSQGQFFS